MLGGCVGGGGGWGVLGLGYDDLMPAISVIRCGHVQGEVAMVVLDCKDQTMEMAWWQWRSSKQFSNLILNLNLIHLRFFWYRTARNVSYFLLADCSKEYISNLSFAHHNSIFCEIAILIFNPIAVMQLIDE